MSVVYWTENDNFSRPTWRAKTAVAVLDIVSITYHWTLRRWPGAGMKSILFDQHGQIVRTNRAFLAGLKRESEAQNVFR